VDEILLGLLLAAVSRLRKPKGVLNKPGVG
jgi:hypothetical protein